MKPLLLHFMLVFSIACTNEDKGIRSPTTIGYYTVTSNGKTWDSNVINTSHDDNPDTLRSITLPAANHYNPGGREVLRFRNVVLKPGKYLFDSMMYDAREAQLCASFSPEIGGAEGDYYLSPAPNPENYLIVESYDASLGLLKGSFQLFMVHDPSHTKFDPSLPDTLRFTQGKLSLILKK